MPLRCLLVDDNAAFLSSAARLLGDQGIDVVACAQSSSEALERASAILPDIALVDVQLGHEDGLELARRLGAEVPSMRIVLISTHSRDDVAELILETPAIGFLPKSALSADAVAGLLDQ